MDDRAKANDPTQYRIVVGEHDLHKKEGQYTLQYFTLC